MLNYISHSLVHWSEPMKKVFNLFRDRYYNLFHLTIFFSSLANDCERFASLYYEKLKCSQKTLKEIEYFKKNILYLNSIKKNLMKIKEDLDKIKFDVDETEEINIWVPEGYQLPPDIFKRPQD